MNALILMPAFFHSTEKGNSFAAILKCSGVRRFFCLFLLAALGLPLFILALPAQTNAPPVPGGRCLFIVDTSSAMRRRAENSAKVVGDLLLSGINGELQSGDTIGLWTFNEEVHAGQYPLQRWTPQTAHTISMGTIGFLQRQPYEKKSRLGPALSEMLEIVKNSDKITIVIVSDGESTVAGTPYDREIYEVCKKHSSEQRRLRMPFLIILRAQKGEFIGHAVNLPPWPVVIPPFAPELKLSEPLVAKEVVTPPQANVVTPAVISTNLQPTPPLLIAEQIPQPPSESPKPLSVESVPAQAPSKPADTSPSAPPPVNPVTSEPPKSEPTTQSSPVPPTPVTAEPNPASAQATEPAKSAPSPPASVAPQIPAPPSGTSGKTNAPTAVRSRPVVQATAVSTGNVLLKHKWILIGGGVLLIGALALVFAALRRPRPPQKISLITRSMNQRDDR